MATVVVFLRSVFIDQTPIWDACVMAFTANPSVLQKSPLVIIYREGARTVSRTLIYSQPKDGVWGITPICTRNGCPTQPGDVFSKTHKVNKTHTHTRASWICKRCRFKTDVFERPAWITEVLNRLNFFFYEFPFEGKVTTLASERTWIPDKTN
jgi:hypothetical protein